MKDRADYEEKPRIPPGRNSIEETHFKEGKYSR